MTPHDIEIPDHQMRYDLAIAIAAMPFPITDRATIAMELARVFDERIVARHLNGSICRAAEMRRAMGWRR